VEVRDNEQASGLLPNTLSFDTFLLDQIEYSKSNMNQYNQKLSFAHVEKEEIKNFQNKFDQKT
jgi:hypothetical protein